MNEIDQLQIYKVLLPATLICYHNAKDANNRHFYDMVGSCLAAATIYDCRQLPIGFLEDTGDAYLHELKETQGVLKLPELTCYFEFPDHIYVIAGTAMSEEMNGTITKGDETWEFQPPQVGSVCYYGWTFYPPISPEIVAEAMIPQAGIITNMHFDDLKSGPPFDSAIGIGAAKKAGDAATAYGKFLMAGVIALLNEKYLIDHVKKDPKPYINKIRRKKGKPPISSDTHLLRVNVPMVRYEARKHEPTGRHHESPCLHWRRGHRRILPPLYEGDNQARSTWVKRHLVGDPSKGYAPVKGYRLRYKEPPAEAIRVQ
jgi:hypothetical protein